MIDNTVVQWNGTNLNKRKLSIDKKEFVCEKSTSTLTQPVSCIQKLTKSSPHIYHNEDDDNNNYKNNMKCIRINNLEDVTNVLCNGKCDKIKRTNNNDKVQSFNILVQSAKNKITTRNNRKRRLKEKSQSLVNNNVNFWRTKNSLQHQPSVCDLIKCLPVCLKISVLAFLWCINLDLVTATLSTTITKPINQNFTSISGNFLINNNDNSYSALNDELIRPVNEDYDGHYTHTWAVHIPNGEDNDLANIVARDHGFMNLGKVSLQKLRN